MHQDIGEGRKPESELINVGTGQVVSIREQARTIQFVVGYEGDISFDTSKPDATLRKLMDVSKINQLGWQARVDLYQGIEKNYRWFKEHVATSRGLCVSR